MEVSEISVIYIYIYREREREREREINEIATSMPLCSQIRLELRT